VSLIGVDNQKNGNAFENLREQLAAEGSDGALLAANIQDNPICSIFLEETIPCLIVIWKRYATSMQLRFIHETIIIALETHNLSKILSDDTELCQSAP